ncbi:phosphoenolpyruvate hydrolase family protein [Chloroflexota bacterium]
MRIPRAECLRRLQKTVAEGRPILGVGAGIGLSAKCAEAGGADIIIIYNSGRYRMAGRGSMAGRMPYGDANAIVVDMAAEVLPVVKDTPVLAGVCGTDPFRLMPVFLKQLCDMQFSGVQNYPTVGLYEPEMATRQNLEATGMGYNLEVDMIAQAHKLDMLTCPYVFDEETAGDMARAGADVLVAHMGVTAKGMIGAEVSVTLEQAAEKTQQIHDAAKKVNPDILVICHGGPIAEPQDVEFMLKNTRGIAGFFGASSVERIPVERAITGAVREFKSIPLK